MSTLFKPITLGAGLKLAHRVVMAPLTRIRADQSHVHTDLAVKYYAQRASEPGSLLITEATFITNQAGGGDNVPGIWNQAQIDAWKRVTDAVHEKGSFIVLQLWAVGRAAEMPVLEREGRAHDFVSSSAVPMQEGAPVPRPLEENEIQQYIKDFGQAAKNAITAGFDGVEIHGANGYLIDQFIQDTVNHREDAWGGNVENRSRFALEIAKTVIDAVGADKVGIRLSPFSSFQGMKMADPVPQFSHLIHGLKELKLAYIHLVEPRVSGYMPVEVTTESINFALDIWGKTSPVFLAGGFDRDSAIRVSEEHPDNDILVVFGRLYIANPDLPFRIQKNVALNAYDRSTFYVPESEKGYIDYPFSKEWTEAHPVAAPTA